MSRRRYVATGLFVFSIWALLAACGAGAEQTPGVAPPIPGFTAHITDTIEIFLPQTFVQADPLEVTAALPAAVASREPQLATQIASQSAASPIPEFLAWDTESAASGATTSLMIAPDHTIPQRSLPQVADAIVASRPQARDVEQAQFQVGGFDAIRIAYRIPLETLSVTQVHYIVSLRGSVWAVVFTTPTEEYQRRAAEFDESASSFRVLRAPLISDYLAHNSQSVVTLVGAGLIVLGALSSWLRRRRRAAGSEESAVRA